MQEMKLESGKWKIEKRKAKSETGNWELETENWKNEKRKSRAEGANHAARTIDIRFQKEYH
jgi:hypothetical protein